MQHFDVKCTLSPNRVLPCSLLSDLRCVWISADLSANQGMWQWSWEWCFWSWERFKRFFENLDWKWGLNWNYFLLLILNEMKWMTFDSWLASFAGSLWILCLGFTSAGGSDVWVSVGTLVNRLSGPQHSHLRLMMASIAGRWRGFNASPLAPQKWR